MSKMFVGIMKRIWERWVDRPKTGRSLLKPEIKYVEDKSEI